MAEHGPDDALIDALGPQQLGALGAVLLGIHLVVQIVQQAGKAPQLLVLARPFGEVAHAAFHGQGVLAQRLALVVAAEQCIGLFPAGYHGKTSFDVARPAILAL